MKALVPPRPEVAILLNSVGHRAQAADTSSSLIPDGPIDWNDLLQTAAAHGVTEMLVSPLTAQPAKVPGWVVARLNQCLIEAVGQNLNRTGQLIAILQRLAHHGIRALTFKGPAFASHMHGGLGRRVSNDVDVLIDRPNAARARAALLADGYSLAPRRRYRAGSQLYGLYPPAGRTDVLRSGHPGETDVDVQVGLAEWPHGIRISTSALFERAITVDVAGQRLPTLCVNDAMLSMAIHGLQHGWSFLRAASDIDAVAAQVTDWDGVIEQARVARMSRVLWVALLMTGGLLDSSIPARVLARAAQDTQAVAIAEGAAARLFANPWNATVEWGARSWGPSFQEGALRRMQYHTRKLTYEWFLKWPWDEWLNRRA
jgi:hypothetical protein